MVLSPEHAAGSADHDGCSEGGSDGLSGRASFKSDFERTELVKKKTGVFTGAFAINPVNNERIPIWIADYVLASYGTGAIMAVPAHDERDFAFARQFGLPIRTVVTPTPEWLQQTGSTVDDLQEAYTDDGVACNSGLIDGMSTADGKQQMMNWLEEKGLGSRRVNFKLRD